MKSLFERMGGTYKQVGDYLLPDVELPEEKPSGVWGQRHYKYLRNANHILFSHLTISGKMNDYLADIDKQAEEMFSQLVKQLAERDGITETLKVADQMEWVRRMNTVRAQATEIVNEELIFG
ncbi:MAG: TnpV protein [Lachnospiraceae bacterium]|nr:TnpV protein [Candidatus Minthocola equi]